MRKRKTGKGEHPPMSDAGEYLSPHPDLSDFGQDSPDVEANERTAQAVERKRGKQAGSIHITLSPEALSWITDLALRERRTVRDQVAYMVESHQRQEAYARELQERMPKMTLAPTAHPWARAVEEQGGVVNGPEQVVEMEPSAGWRQV